MSEYYNDDCVRNDSQIDIELIVIIFSRNSHWTNLNEMHLLITNFLWHQMTLVVFPVYLHNKVFLKRNQAKFIQKINTEKSKLTKQMYCSVFTDRY